MRAIIRDVYGVRIGRVSDYGKDLAYIHDAGFGDFARNASAGLFEMLKQNSITRGLIVDLGCGSGIWARKLTDRGYDVLGVDVSPEMIRIAKNNAPRARFTAQSLFRFSIPKCRAVTSIGECLNYLFDREAPSKMKSLFARIYDALEPGGIFVCDVAQPSAARCENPRIRVVEGKDWFVIAEVTKKLEQRLLSRRITAFRKIAGKYRRSDELHRQRLYSGWEIARLLRAAGFRAQLRRGYGDFQLPSTHVVLFARKPL